MHGNALLKEIRRHLIAFPLLQWKEMDEDCLLRHQFSWDHKIRIKDKYEQEAWRDGWIKEFDAEPVEVSSVITLPIFRSI